MKITLRKFSLLKDGGAYLLGLFATQNVVYLFTIGNTKINIEWITAFLIFFTFCISKPNKVIKTILSTPKEMKYYIISIFFSIVSAIFYLAFSKNNFITSFFTGIIALFLNLCIFFDCILLKHYKKSIIKGLYHGFILNVFFSIMQYIAFNNGTFLTLYSYFPQDAFYVSIPWTKAHILSANQDYLIYSYRAMGFFLECSYFVAHMTALILLIFTYKKNNVLFYILTISITFLIALSGSGNFIIFLFGLILYYFISKKKVKKLSKNKLAKRLGFIFILLFVVLFLSSRINITDLTDMLKLSFDGANIKDSSNNERFSFMMSALSLCLKYPLGVGYNIASKALIAYSGAHASFNYWITVFLELGPLGLICYIYMMWINSINCIKEKNIIINKLGIILLIMWFYQFANGTGFTPIIWIILSLIFIEKNNRKDGIVNIYE